MHGATTCFEKVRAGAFRLRDARIGPKGRENDEVFAEAGVPIRDGAEGDWYARWRRGAKTAAWCHIFASRQVSDQFGRIC